MTLTTEQAPAGEILPDRITPDFVRDELYRIRERRIEPFGEARTSGRHVTVSWVGDLQQGDGGKGAMTDRLAAHHDVVLRVQGGDNAGHTTRFRAADGSDVTIKNHILPSGLRYPGVFGILGNGVLVNLDRLGTELREYRDLGVDLDGRLFVSDRAHLVLPLHLAVDRRQEVDRQQDAIGTTHRGIGPANVSKVNRIGLRAGDLSDAGVIRRRIEANVQFFGLDKEQIELNIEWIEQHRPVLESRLVDSSRVVNDLVAAGRSVLVEGAQGPLIDLEHGIYPYVTTSPTAVYSVSSGGGLDVARIDNRVGVLKTYQTMVGNGAFVSEDRGLLGERLRAEGNELGTTTGRDRRCGWLDLVQARWAAEVNRFDSVVLTKLDVLDSFDTIGLCVGYERNGETVVEFKADNSFLEECTPIITYVKGWSRPTGDAKSWQELPENAKAFCGLVQAHLGVEVGAVTVGPRDSDMHPVPGTGFARWLESR